MNKYTLINGEVHKSKLSPASFTAKYRRLDTLRVIIEGNESKVGLAIYNKVINALNKDVFTGIIRLTFTEKDFLSYYLESDMLSVKDKYVIESFI